MTAQELKDKYEADLKQLQEDCNHKHRSGWIKEEWAPAHGTGFEVEVCEDCWVVVGRRGLFSNITSSFSSNKN